MKISFLLISFGAFSLAAALSTTATAQSSFNPGAGGSNPFSRVYAAPSNPPAPQATPNAGTGMPPGTFTNNGAGMSQPNNFAYSNEPIDPNHKLNSGDQLSFQVAEDRDDRSQVLLVVTASGEVNIPLVGLMPAAGKSVSQFTSEVKARLEREYYYHATVMMGLNTIAQRQSRGRVYVTGAVQSVGPVELPVDEKLTVSKAIIKAGGFKAIADQRRVRLLDKDGKDRGMKIDVKDILSGKSKRGDTILEPGDTVVVTERSILIN